MSQSLKLAKSFLGKQVQLIIDRPLGSRHPRHEFFYEVNYGYVPGTLAPDGEALDAYFLGVSEPLNKAQGSCVAIVHRRDDDDDKLVVLPVALELSNEAILAAVAFQEQWFDSILLRAF